MLPVSAELLWAARGVIWNPKTCVMWKNNWREIRSSLYWGKTSHYKSSNWNTSEEHAENKDWALKNYCLVSASCWAPVQTAEGEEEQLHVFHCIIPDNQQKHITCNVCLGYHQLLLIECWAYELQTCLSFPHLAVHLLATESRWCFLNVFSITNTIRFILWPSIYV